jgi:hypothetical protein
MGDCERLGLVERVPRAAFKSLIILALAASDHNRSRRIRRVRRIPGRIQVSPDHVDIHRPYAVRPDRRATPPTAREEVANPAAP